MLFLQKCIDFTKNMQYTYSMTVQIDFPADRPGDSRNGIHTEGLTAFVSSINIYFSK